MKPRVLIIQNKLQIVSQNETRGGFATAIINEFGQLDSIVLSDPGIGYTIVPDVSIALPEEGQRAVVEAVNKLDKIDSFNIVNPGFGYTSTNPPIVHIAPPNYPIEVVEANDYSVIMESLLDLELSPVEKQLNWFLTSLFLMTLI